MIIESVSRKFDGRDFSGFRGALEHMGDVLDDGRVLTRSYLKAITKSYGLREGEYRVLEKFLRFNALELNGGYRIFVSRSRFKRKAFYFKKEGNVERIEKIRLNVENTKRLIEEGLL